MRPLALLLAAAFAAPVLSAPASALPCRDFTMTVPECTEPLRDRLQHLCFPPDPADPYGC